MRVRGIADDAAANAYAESVYLPAYNARYAVPAASAVDYHLPRNPEVRDEDVFCLEHVRTVGNDFVVQFGKQGLQLDRAARGRVPAGSRVIVRQTREGELRVIHVSRFTESGSAGGPLPRPARRSRHPRRMRRARAPRGSRTDLRPITPGGAGSRSSG